MSYTPTEWHTGDIVTEDKLNNLEQGVVDAQYPDYTAADKGKVLGLGDADPVVTTIVPEQSLTVTADSDATVANVDAELFVVGAEGTLIVDEDSFNVTITDTDPHNPDPMFECYKDNVVYAMYMEDGAYHFYVSDDNTGDLIPGTYTVSLSSLVAPTTQTVIVPEQTVTMEIVEGIGDAELTGDSDFVRNANEGDILNATIDGDTIVLTAESVSPPIGDPYIIFASDNVEIGLNALTNNIFVALLNQVGETKTITISATASVPAVEPKWTQASVGSGPFIIYADPNGTATSESGGTVAVIPTTVLGTDLMDVYDFNTFMWKQPLYVNWPAVTSIGGAIWDYATASYLSMVEDLTAVTDNQVIYKSATIEYKLRIDEIDPSAPICILASAK